MRIVTSWSPCSARNGFEEFGCNSSLRYNDVIAVSIGLARRIGTDRPFGGDKDMKQQTPLVVYLDTSVLGGYYDQAFLNDTRQLFQLIRDRRVTIAVSDMLFAEIARAPKPIGDLLQEIVRLGARTIPINEEAISLQDAYLKAGVVSQRWADDAMHVALASIGRVDAIVSWNFKHLVDPRRARAFNGVNLANGYGLIEIRSPVDIVRIVEAKK